MFAHFASILPPVPSGTELTALLVVVCFSAGLNVYATVAMLGLLSHAHVLTLPASLRLVDNWYVIAVCGVLFLVEFVGDKIPIFDLLWNAMHTFVRVPVAGLLTYGATAQLPEWERLVATLAGFADRAGRAQRENRGAGGGVTLAGALFQYRAESQ